MMISRSRSAALPTRRAVVAGLSAATAALVVPARAAIDPIAAIEARNGGRLGVFALDTGSGRSLAHRADERFIMCSTFKVLAAAAVLARVDAHGDRLDRRLPFEAAEVIGYAPDTKAHAAEGGMTLEALCAAAVSHSDSTAANLILADLGGPAAVTRYLRRLGDGTTRLDRDEPTVNHPDGALDTTTPRAFAATLQTLLLGTALAPASRASLNGWMEAGNTGASRIRAGVPAGWIVGDKTGTASAEANDVALLRPPGLAPIVLTAFYDAAGVGDAARDAVLREVGTLAAGLAA